MLRRVAGEFGQRLRAYGIRAAILVPDRTEHSQSFQDFAAEADRGSSFRFFADEDAATNWLASARGTLQTER